MAKQKTIKGPKTEQPKGKGKKPKDPIADASLESLRDELLSIRRANDYAKELGVKADQAKAKSNAAKAAYESSQRELNSLIDELSTPTLFRPAIDEKKKDKPDWTSFGIEEPYGDGGTTIASLIPTAVKKALVAKKLTTVGAIAKYTSDLDLTSIEGIGNAGASALEDSLESFWRDSGIARPKEDKPKRVVEPGKCDKCGKEITARDINLGGPCLDPEGKRFCEPAHRDWYAREKKKDADAKKKTDKEKSERAAA